LNGIGTSIFGRYPLEEAAKAYARVASGNGGKVVLVMDARKGSWMQAA
jgi:hypothetical protein